MKSKIKERLRDLVDLVGVSGSEQEVVKYLQEHFSSYADEVSVDKNGNVITIQLIWHSLFDYQHI